jgi:hypothetical protein
MENRDVRVLPRAVEDKGCPVRGNVERREIAQIAEAREQTGGLRGEIDPEIQRRYERQVDQARSVG